MGRQTQISSSALSSKDSLGDSLLRWSLCHVQPGRALRFAAGPNRAFQPPGWLTGKARATSGTSRHDGCANTGRPDPDPIGRMGIYLAPATGSMESSRPTSLPDSALASRRSLPLGGAAPKAITVFKCELPPNSSLSPKSIYPLAHPKCARDRHHLDAGAKVVRHETKGGFSVEMKWPAQDAYEF